MKTRPLAPRTVVQYQRVMQRAFGEFDPTGLDAAPAVVREWAESERRVLRHAIRDHFARLGKEEAGVHLANTVPSVYSVRRVAPKPSGDEADLFEQRARRYPKEKYRPLFALMMRLGLRAEEVLNLTREHVLEAAETGALVFVRKGGKEAVLPTKHLKAELNALLRVKQALPRDTAAQMQALTSGAPFDWQLVGDIIASPPAANTTRYNLLNRAVKHCAKLAGLDTKVWSPHKLRHAFATRMHADGASMRVVQEALGHASIVTTQRYVNVDHADIGKFVRGPK